MILKIALRSNLYTLAAGLILFASAGAASAQTLDRLAEADANGDGNIAWQEMLYMRADIFKRLDRNGDGVADSNDKPRIPVAQKRFDEVFNSLRGADANGDGRITKSEMLNGPAPLFENGDTNGDKVLSAAELSALREQASQRR